MSASSVPLRHLTSSALSHSLSRLQRPGSSPGRLMEDALVCRALVQFVPVERPWNPGGDLWNDQTLTPPMSECGAGSRHRKQLDKNAGRKTRKTGATTLDAGWRCSYSVIYHCFKILSFVFFCESVKTKNGRTGPVKKKERCAVALHARDCRCRFHPVIGVWRWHHWETRVRKRASRCSSDESRDHFRNHVNFSGFNKVTLKNNTVFIRVLHS